MDLNDKFHCCGSECKYNEHFDAHYCQKCDEWLEEKCNDQECKYCAERPEKPSSSLSI
jgi:hypothetical protein